MEDTMIQVYSLNRRKPKFGIVQEATDSLVSVVANVERRKTRHVIRMGPDAFGRLVRILRGTGRLTDNAYSCVEEQAAKSLYILAHNERNRSIGFFFHRSTETTSRHFHNFLRAIILLEDKFFIQPDGTQVPPEIRYNNRFFPYFKKNNGQKPDRNFSHAAYDVAVKAMNERFTVK
ncbi:hypothetical protein RJ640_007765, partial [Escallonia rubra]